MKFNAAIATACLLLLLQGCGTPENKQAQPEPQPTAAQKQPDEYKAKLNVFTRDDNWKESLAYFQAEVQKDPKSAEAHCFLGVSALKMRNLELAETELLLAVKLDPKLALAQAYLGWLYAEKGDFPRAEESLARARALKPDLSAIYEITAHMEKLRGNYDTTLTQLEESQKKDYKSSRSLALAEIYFAKGDKKKARQNLRAALKKESGDYKALTSMGAIYISEKKYLHAITTLERSRKINPDFPITHLNLGVAYMKFRKIKPAIESLEKAAQLMPASDLPHFYLGEAYLMARDKKKAEREYMQARSLNPDNRRAAEALARLKR